MSKKATDILFSEAVQTMQAKMGSGELMAKLDARNHWNGQLSTEQIAFIRNRDSFYLGTASSAGRPYIQHRGGSRGFIKVENESTLWFPDFAGNRQYISSGNLSENSQAFIFFMDYAQQRRLKLWGRATLLPADAYTLNSNQKPPHGKIERIIQFEIEALDENCRQHITQRYTDEEYDLKLASAEKEIKQLKQTIQRLEKALHEQGY